MLTFFAVPKPFQGHIGVIQRNAIRSWVRLPLAHRVILLGDDDGVVEASAELGVEHGGAIQRNTFATPLLDDALRRGHELSQDGVLCFVNADIVLGSDFAAAVRLVASLARPFLLAGRRTNLDVKDELTFDQSWEDCLRERVRVAGEVQHAGAIDYFVFSRGLWGDVPPFALGRPGFDNWLIYRARAQGAMVVDASPSVVAVHQSHGFPNGAPSEARWTGPEYEENAALLGGEENRFTLDDATRRLVAGRLGLPPRRCWRRRIATEAMLRPRLSSLLRALLALADRSHRLRSRLSLTLSSREKNETVG